MVIYSILDVSRHQLLGQSMVLKLPYKDIFICLLLVLIYLSLQAGSESFEHSTHSMLTLLLPCFFLRLSHAVHLTKPVLFAAPPPIIEQHESCLNGPLLIQRKQQFMTFMINFFVFNPILKFLAFSHSQKKVLI